MAAKLTFLGTGSNGGIPQIDCRCPNCQKATSPRHIRHRSSILIEASDKKLLLDCGPDFKDQLEKQHLKTPDLNGIILSHLHWDHCAGLVDLSAGKPHGINIFCHSKVRKSLLTNPFFSFLFPHFAKFSTLPKWLNLIPVKHDPNFFTCALTINTSKKIFIATDIWELTPQAQKELSSSDIIIFDGTFLHRSAHWHMGVEKACQILSLSTAQIWFTHINHSENIHETKSFISQFNFKLAHDNLTLEI